MRPGIVEQSGQGRSDIYLIINNLPISLRFHRKVTAAPFTPVLQLE